jgi:hypothetical protein
MQLGEPLDQRVIQAGEIRRLEVGVHALLPHGVDQGLDDVVGHRAQQVGHGLGDGAELAHVGVAVLDRPRRGGDERRHLAAVPLLRDDGQGRRRGEVQHRGDVLRRTRRPFAEEAHEVVVGVGRVEDRPGVDHRSHLVQLELEARDDPEVAAPAAQPPEELGVRALRDVQQPPVGGDDVGADEVVAGEAVLTHQPADAAAQREAGNARRRNEAAGGGQAVRLGLVVDIGPDRPAANRGAASDRVHVDVVHRTEIDHDPAIDGGEAGDAVTAPAHGDGQVVAPGKGDRGEHVGDAGTTDDHSRAVPVVRSVPDLGGLVVALVLGGQHLPADRVAQLRHALVLRQGFDGMAHGSHSLSYVAGRDWSGAPRSRGAMSKAIVHHLRDPHIGHTP